MNILKNKYTSKNAPRVEIVYDWRKKSGEDKPGSVDVRIYERGGRRSYVATGVHVLPRNWNEELRIVYGREDAAELNKKIKMQYEKCLQGVKDAVQDAEDGRPSITTNGMRVDNSDSSFLDWVDAYITRQEELGLLSAGTVRRHRVSQRFLENFGKMRKWEDVTPAKVRLYLDFVRRKTTKKRAGEENSEQVRIVQSTIYNYWKNLRTWVNAAIKEGHLAPRCIAGITESRGESAVREHLSLDDIKRLKDVPLPLPHLRRARDRFLVQAGTGLSFCDLTNVDWSRIEEVGGMRCMNGRRGKTQKQYFFVMLDFAWEALQRLGGDVPPISLTDYNDYIGIVMQRAGIDKHITSHCARHTYAYICLVNEVPMASLQVALGHSNIRTTQIYGRMMNIDVINQFAKKSSK